MKHIQLILWCLLALAVSPLLAAGDDCPALVQQALDATNTLCDSTGRNQACYGNALLQARPQPNVNNFVFDQPGNITNLSDLKSLRLSPMALDKGQWGVALMRLQANLPASSRATVTLLSFGDVLLENAAKVPTTLNVTVLGRDFVNVRWRPNVNAGVVAVVNPRQTLTAVERLEDSSWLRIELPDSGETGWVNARLVESVDNLAQLNVAGASEPSYRPMQAFYFESGSDDSACAEMPKNGLIIQTPEGAGEVRLWINEVKVSMGSTVFLQAERGGPMTVTTLEGHAAVEAMGITHTAVAGSSVQVKLDEQMKPAEPPGLPVAYSMAAVEQLPIKNLDREIVVHPPLTEQEIAAVQDNQGRRNNNDGVCVPPCNPNGGANNPAGSDSRDCPGNSCNSNGNGNGNNQNCPGNSCNNGNNNNNRNDGGNGGNRNDG